LVDLILVYHLPASMTLLLDRLVILANSNLDTRLIHATVPFNYVSCKYFSFSLFAPLL
jgi:hypothetical protein